MFVGEAGPVQPYELKSKRTFCCFLHTLTQHGYFVDGAPADIEGLVLSSYVGEHDMTCLTWLLFQCIPDIHKQPNPNHFSKANGALSAWQTMFAGRRSARQGSYLDFTLNGLHLVF